MVACTQQVQSDLSQPQAQVRNVEILKNGNTSGIETQEINYGSANGFLAMPKAEGKYPAVVMIHEC